MTADPNAIEHWAAVQAATVRLPRPAPTGRNSAAPAQPAPPSIPAVLTAVTEISAWDTPGDACGVSVWADPDGRLRLAVGEGNGEVRIWDPETGELLRTLTEPAAEVYSVDLGLDGSGRLLLAAGSTDGSVFVGDAETGELVHHVSFGGGGPGAEVMVSWGYRPDGRSLLAIGTAGGMFLWDPESGDRIDPIPSLNATTQAMSWAAADDGSLLLATAGGDAASPVVRIYDVGTRQVRAVTTRHADGVRNVTWTRPAGGPLMFVTVGSVAYSADEAPNGFHGESSIGLWRQGPDGEFGGELVDLAQGWLRVMRWVPLPDGQALLVGNSDTSLFVLDGTTLELLHSEPVDFYGRGLDHLDWAMRPDGSLVLCATSNRSRVHVWEVTLDPPAGAGMPHGTGLVTSRGHPPQHGTLVIPPQDVTPPFRLDGVADTYSVRCAVRADGEVLAATWHSDHRLRIWSATGGTLLHTITLTNSSTQRFAWGHRPDGRLLLATTRRLSPEIHIWDTETWQLMATCIHPSDSRSSDVHCIAWFHDQDGRLLLASGSQSADVVCVADPESGETLRTFRGVAGGSWVSDTIRTIVAGRLADGRCVLVIGGARTPARLLDPATGEILCELPAAASGTSTVGEVNGGMWGAAWGHGPDGRPEVAITGYDGVIRVWDPQTVQVQRRLPAGNQVIYSLAWLDRPGWPSVLIAANGAGTVQIWDAGSGAELAQLPGKPGTIINGIDIAVAPDGDVLLFAIASAKADDPRPLRVWRIATGAETTSGTPDDTRAALGGYQAAELADGLLRLGDGGLWPPLGLLADLVALTAPASSPGAGLGDGRLAALGGEGGIGRLRDLVASQPGWDQAARVAFAALVVSSLGLPERYAPPEEADRASLRGALAGALTALSVAPAKASPPPAADMDRPWQASIGDVRDAVTAISDQTVTLLRILGPKACGADPLLPLRLTHHTLRLPVLSERELRLLARSDSQRAVDSQATATGTLVYSPGTIGITRSGPVTRLVPSQLALPRDLLAAHLAEDQGQYREHRAPTPPAPEPVTLILDTTPPTFGPAGHTLRLAAHLIATTLWEHGEFPYLVTLTAPDALAELRAPSDLLSMWASTTLDDPSLALTAARRTAAVTGQPAVFCTHHHTARTDWSPGPATRLLTSHQPPERVPSPPSGPWHVHLPPDPAPELLSAAISRLLIRGAD